MTISENRCIYLEFVLPFPLLFEAYQNRCGSVGSWEQPDVCPLILKSRMKRAERTCILLTTSVKRKTMISNDFPTVLKVHEFLKHLEYPLFLASKSWRLKLIFAIVPSFYTDTLISRRTRKSNRSTFAISRPRFLTFYIQIPPLFSFHLTRYLGQTLAAVCYRRSIRP